MTAESPQAPPKPASRSLHVQDVSVRATLKAEPGRVGDQRLSLRAGRGTWLQRLRMSADGHTAYQTQTVACRDHPGCSALHITVR